MIEYTFFGKEAKFHHIGLAVESIHVVSPPSEVFVERGQRVSLAFVLVNGIRIELVEPLGDNSPVARSLREGVKLLHLCYEVPHLEEALEQCRAAGFYRLSQLLPAETYGNRRVVWVYSKQYGLFELLEQDPSPSTGSKRPSTGP